MNNINELTAKLKAVARHSVDGYGRQDICYNDPEGEFVFYSDYEALTGVLEAAEKQRNSWRHLAKQNIEEREKDLTALAEARQRIADLESKLAQNESWSASAQNYIAELEARTLDVKLPEGKDSPQGWKVDPDFISKVQDAIGYDEECQCWEGTPSMEMVEAVLIAAAGIKLQIEGE